MYRSRCAIVVLCAVLLPSVSPAQDDVARAARQCAGIQEDALRLTCFDRLFTRAVPVAAEAAAGAAASIPAVPAATKDFGLTDAQKQAREPGQAKKPELAEISAAATAVTRRKTGETLVTLDNGQVWLQSDPTTRLLVKAGDMVTISSASFGSYFMRANDRPPVRVKRVK